MSVSLQQNVIDTATMSGEGNWERLCMPMDSILNTYCEVFYEIENVMDK